MKQIITRHKRNWIHKEKVLKMIKDNKIFETIRVNEIEIDWIPKAIEFINDWGERSVVYTYRNITEDDIEAIKIDLYNAYKNNYFVTNLLDPL